MTNIVITGIDGFLGSTIKQVLQKDYAVYDFGLDITDKEKVKNYSLEGKKVDYILHTAAMIDVDQCEKEPAKCYQVNVEGTRHVRDLAKSLGAKLIFISSSIVFSGKEGNYKETDVPYPRNFYALSKLLGEQLVLDYDGGYVVRLNLLGMHPKLGSRGINFFELVHDAVKNNKDLTLFDDILVNPISNWTAAQSIATIIEKNPKEQIFHFGSKTPLSKADIGKMIIQKIGNYKGNAVAVSSSSVQQDVLRPKNLWLNVENTEKVLGVLMPSVESEIEKIFNEQKQTMISINNKPIGAGHPAYIIAEVGCNFDGSLERLKMLAKLAKDSGADAFKIQNFLASKLVSQKGFDGLKISHQAKWEKPVAQVYKEAEFPREWLKEIADYCKSINIDFFSSPYDIEAVELLENIGVPAYKIGSGEIDNLDFLRHVAKTQKPIILATGASSLEEVQKAVLAIRSTGNQQIILLQCVTNYPSMLADANLNAMTTFKKEFGTEVGLSDHTVGKEGGGDDPLGGITAPLAMVALGGVLIEKHFTDDTKRKGNDHPFAMDATAFKNMVDGMRALEKSLGDGQKRLLDSEKETVIVQRRGVYAKQDIEIGEEITREKIEFLRPALFLSLSQVDTILGKKAKYKIGAGDPIKPDVV